MNARYQPALGPALRHWRLRQKADGRLLRLMVLGSFLPAAVFFLIPSPGSAFVLGLFLAALGAACLRLLFSAARVAEIDHLIHPAPEVIDVEVLDYPDLHLLGPGCGLSDNSTYLPTSRLAGDENGFN